MNTIDWSGGNPFAEPEIPMRPRSALFRIAPADVGTPQQESLISLLVRTAYAHSVNPRHLVGKVFSEVDPAIAGLAYAGFFTNLAGTINGLGKYAELFVSAMERLTVRGDLRRLTLLPWREFFPHNGQGLLARHPRWCPVCLFQQRLRGEETSFPLAWSLEVVHTCPIHRRRLEELCPHCDKRQPFIPRYPDLAVCDLCRRPLVSNALLVNGSNDKRPSDLESWVTKAVGQMIACQAEGDFQPSVGRFKSFLLDRVAAATGGNRAAFCRAIGLPPRALNNWISKGERPSITQFLMFCYGMRVTPMEILRIGETNGADLLLAVDPLKRRAPCPRLFPTRKEEVKALLQLRLAASECLPVSKIASNIGFAARSLRYWFPEVCGQITAKYREAEKNRVVAHRAEQCRRVVEIVQQLLEAGEYPSRRRVNTFLRMEHMSLAQPHLLGAYLVATTKGA